MGDVRRGHGGLDVIVNDSQPFGPLDTESLAELDHAQTDQLFDRTNLIYAQTAGPERPAYIIGRKGAGKTAFLLGTGPRPEVLRTSSVYSELLATLRRYAEVRGPLFADQVADIWTALFEHVAIAHACRTATSSDPTDLQLLWDYCDGRSRAIPAATTVAEQYLADLRRRITDPSVEGLREVLDGLARGGVTFARARRALRVVLGARTTTPTIVMDNLEDLHARIHEVRDPLAGLFACVGRVMQPPPEDRPFGVHVCLPSELYASIQEISANPEKDFRDNHLTIYWTAGELLHLAGSRLRFFLRTHHPDELAAVLHRTPLAREGSRNCEVELLRATLPASVQGRLRVVEDPVAYLLRHTQLLPRHLIQILNRVYGSRRGSLPWAVSAEAVVRGTHAAEELLVRGILAAHQETFPGASAALGRLADRLPVSFSASRLHKVFNQEGIRTLVGADFRDFMAMLFALGAVGVQMDTTKRYTRAKFQYTFGARLNPPEDDADLCFHPLFFNLLHTGSMDRLHATGALPTYPFGCDPADGDYRRTLGYALATGG